MNATTQLSGVKSPFSLSLGRFPFDELIHSPFCTGDTSCPGLLARLDNLLCTFAYEHSVCTTGARMERSLTTRNPRKIRGVNPQFAVSQAQGGVKSRIAS